MALGRERPRRSILFVSHTAEEAGLLGSAWFTDHATVPVDSIVAEIDQDMVGRGRPDDFPRPNGPAASPTYLEVVGDQKLSREFGDDARGGERATARAVRIRSVVRGSPGIRCSTTAAPITTTTRATEFRPSRCRAASTSTTTR